MAKEVKNRVSLDASRFTRGTNQVRRNIKKLERGLTIDMKKAARFASRGIMAVGAAGAAAGVGLTIGINKAIQLGARLDHMADATGMAAGELRVLEQAFEDNGVSAEQVGKTVNKLQKSIVEGSQGLTTYERAFEALGLSTENLLKMTPEQQFAAVAEAISKVEDQSIKAQAAMQIFGRQGAQLMGVFESGAMDDARKSLGKQTEILNRRASDFEDAATLIDRAGNKLSGFFVGVSDRIVDTILPLLNRMDSMDFAEQGQKFGDGLEKGIRAVIGVFQGNTFGDLVANALIVGGKEFLNAIVRGWSGIALGFWEMFKKGWSENLAAITNGFEILARGFLVKILDGLSAAADIVGMNAKAASLSQSAASQEAKIRDARDEFKGNIDPATRIEKLMDAFEEGMVKASGLTLFDTSENKSAIAEIIKTAMGSVETQQPSNMINFPNSEGGGGGTIPAGTDAQESSRAQQFAAASSLATIGGGGGVASVNSATEALVDQTKTQTRILKESLEVAKDLSLKIGQSLSAPKLATLQ